MTSPHLEWEALGDRWFSKSELYEMDWKNVDNGLGIGLERYKVAVGALGGPIALSVDPTVAVKQRIGQRGMTIDIYSPSGFRECVISWDKAHIVDIGWSREERLVIVTEDANVYLYDVLGQHTRLGKFYSSFGMGNLAKDAEIAAVKFAPHGQGLVVLTKKDSFFSVLNYEDPKPRRLATFKDGNDADLDESSGVSSVLSWAIHINDRALEVIVAAANKNIYILDTTEAWMPVLDPSQLEEYSAMSVSPNGEYVALFGGKKIWVVSADFSKNLSAFEVGSKVAPRQLEWCGSDSVVAYWDQLGQGTGTLLMVSAHATEKEKYINYPYDKRVHLMTEIDGLRVIGEDHHEFIQAVPGAVEVIFQLGLAYHQEPGQMLYMARQGFEQRDPMADDLIRQIKDMDGDGLYEAIEKCIEAAGHEFEPSRQRSLLRAARFGMDFVDSNPASFKRMCKALRVLYHLRDYHVAIHLTYEQFKVLGTKVVIDRLINRNRHWLAAEICKYLKIDGIKGSNRVLVHWATQMVREDKSDDIVARTVIEKLDGVQGVSYAEIARAAMMESKQELAVQLLQCEPKFSDQVPLLLGMQEDSLALEKAVASGDTGLIQFVLLNLYQKITGKGEFLSFINTRPTARDLFLQYCRENDKDMLKDFYYSHDILNETANLDIIEAFEDKSVDGRIQTLKKAARNFTNAREYTFQAKATEEQAALLTAQKILEKRYPGEEFMNLPLGDSLYRIILAGDQDQANKLRKDFKVPDKRFWWIKVKALADANNFSELERFSKAKKSPIGYEPFVDECIAKNNGFEAKKYIPKCLPENKVLYYCKVGGWEEAVDTAVQMRSEEAFQQIEQLCKGRRDVLKMLSDRRK
eukprot:m.191021 g.191021  ORF g.191021 m.191021 type:complete len:861 (-) comp32419_c1_seq1:81-2663(-)